MTSDRTISRDEFLANELTRLGYGTDPVTAPRFADADDLLDAAVSEELTPETLKAVVWAVKQYPTDWPYQFTLARVLDPKRRERLLQVLSAAGFPEDYLDPRVKAPVTTPTLDFARALEAFDKERG